MVFSLPELEQFGAVDHIELRMPVGAFVDHEVSAPCGMAGADTVLGRLDDPLQFYAPERFEAQLVWLTHGYLEYRFPNPHLRARQSQELATEPGALFGGGALRAGLAIGYIRGDQRRASWHVDLSIRFQRPARQLDARLVAQLEQSVWVAQGLAGCRDDGSSIDGRSISDVTIADLKLGEQPFIAIRIGIDDDAENKGGMNIFGRGFGNHPQDIVLQIDYGPESASAE